MWAAVLIFVALPAALIALAFRIKPLVPPDRTRGDALGGAHAARGMFGSHGLSPDERRVREDTERIRLNLEDVKTRE